MGVGTPSRDLLFSIPGDGGKGAGWSLSGERIVGESLVDAVLFLVVDAQLPHGEDEEENVQAGCYEAVVGDLRVGLLQVSLGQVHVRLVRDVFQEGHRVGPKENPQKNLQEKPQ